MATVTTTYDRYAFLTEEQRASARASLERHRTETPRTRSNAPQGDAVAFSENGRQLAATSPLSREEMEALSYAHLLAFDTDDGGTVTLDLAMDPDSEERYLAARVTVTKPDGSEEILYLPFEPEEAGTENAAEKAAGEAAAADEPPVAPKAEDRPSLMELIEQYGLNTVADASEGLFAAIRARIEASIAAAAETAEETETLEKVKTEREARNSAADGAGGEPADGADGGGEINAVTGKTARTLASYARAASLGSGSISRFSRHY